MKSILLILAIIPALLVANEPTKPAIPAEIAPILTRITPIIKDLDPAPTLTFPEGERTLIVDYLTHTYKVHSRYRTGEIAPNAHDEIGPTYQGFRLIISIATPRPPISSFQSQTLRKPYWETYLQRPIIANTNTVAYSSLSYGSRMNKTTIAKLKAAIDSLAKAP